MINIFKKVLSGGSAAKVKKNNPPLEDYSVYLMNSALHPVSDEEKKKCSERFISHYFNDETHNQWLEEFTEFSINNNGQMKIYIYDYDFMDDMKFKMKPINTTLEINNCTFRKGMSLSLGATISNSIIRYGDIDIEKYATFIECKFKSHTKIYMFDRQEYLPSVSIENSEFCKDIKFIGNVVRNIQIQNSSFKKIHIGSIEVISDIDISDNICECAELKDIKIGDLEGNRTCSVRISSNSFKTSIGYNHIGMSDVSGNGDIRILSNIFDGPSNIIIDHIDLDGKIRIDSMEFNLDEDSSKSNLIMIKNSSIKKAFCISRLEGRFAITMKNNGFNEMSLNDIKTDCGSGRSVLKEMEINGVAVISNISVINFLISRVKFKNETYFESIEHSKYPNVSLNPEDCVFYDMLSLRNFDKTVDLQECAILKPELLICRFSCDREKLLLPISVKPVSGDV